MFASEMLNEHELLHDKYLGVLCPGIGVGVLIFGDGRFPELGDLDTGPGRFLMGLRGPGVRNEPNRWDIPGGGVAKGEHLEDVVERELKEELGVTVRDIKFLFPIEHFPAGQHWLSMTHCAMLADNSPMPAVPEKERDKCTALRYFTLQEALELPTDQITQSMQLNLPRMRDEVGFPS